MLAADDNADGTSKLLQIFCKLCVGFLALGDVRYHHHVEISLHNRLRNVFDVYLVLCQIITYLCDNAHGVLAYDSDNCLLHVSILLFLVLCQSPGKTGNGGLAKNMVCSSKNVYLNLN